MQPQSQLQQQKNERALNFNCKQPKLFVKREKVIKLIVKRDRDRDRERRASKKAYEIFFKNKNGDYNYDDNCDEDDNDEDDQPTK